MIIYNVTVNIENDVAEEWLHWMQTFHIPNVLKTGCFTSNRVLRVLADEDSGGKTYSIQYDCKTMDDFTRYEKEFATALRQEALEKYKDKFVAFRTLLETVS